MIIDYDVFSESVKNKMYNNIINNDNIDVYQVPFNFFYNEIELGDEYKLVLYSKFVSDNEIKDAINNILSGVEIDLSIPWENETSHSALRKDIHIKRIAQMVIDIQNNKPLYPIALWISEESYMHDCYNYIEDGNHRLRALEYLKFTHFPAFVYGSHSKYLIEKIESNK